MGDDVEPFASSRVVEYLRSRILSGDLQPGERIRQDEVARELGSSRLPVREALQILRHRGLVELRPNAGARVMAFDPVECDLMYRVRERSEPLVLAQSAPNLTAADFKNMRRLQAQIATARDPEVFLELDREFHMLSYSGCQMASMLELVDRFWDTTQHYRLKYIELISESGWESVNAEHQLLLSALEDGDVSVAEHLLEGHIRRSRLRLAAHPEAFTITTKSRT
ncbi:MAG: GntR family transcriptional regulator [Leucobacter sp.]